VLTYFGLEAVLWITAEFDTTRANVVCSGRKAFTFVFSYLLFPKPFGVFHGLGISLAMGCGYLLQRAKLREAEHPERDGPAHE
jgi:adenosine 3'-phospho 5'-phosphosulfate transporter B3